MLLLSLARQLQIRRHNSLVDYYRKHYVSIWIFHSSVSCELCDELCEVVAPLVELFLFCLLLWRLDEAIAFYPALVAVYYYRVGGQQLDAGKAVARLQVVVLDCFNESVTYMQLCF